MQVISNRRLILTVHNDPRGDRDSLGLDGSRRRPQRRGARLGLLLHDSGAPRDHDEGRRDGNAPAAGMIHTIGLVQPS